MEEMEGTMRIDPERVSIPLVMIEGNLEVLLEHDIPVTTISLRRIGPAGVVLTIHSTEEQKEVQRALGFQTAPVTE